MFTMDAHELSNKCWMKIKCCTHSHYVYAQSRLCLVYIFFYDIILCLIEHFLKPEKDLKQVIFFYFVELVYSMLNDFVWSLLQIRSPFPLIWAWFRGREVRVFGTLRPSPEPLSNFQTTLKDLILNSSSIINNPKKFYRKPFSPQVLIIL